MLLVQCLPLALTSRRAQSSISPTRCYFIYVWQCTTEQVRSYLVRQSHSKMAYPKQLSSSSNLGYLFFPLLCECTYGSFQVKAALCCLEKHGKILKDAAGHIEQHKYEKFYAMMGQVVQHDTGGPLLQSQLKRWGRCARQVLSFLLAVKLRLHFTIDRVSPSLQASLSLVLKMSMLLPQWTEI